METGGCLDPWMNGWTDRLASLKCASECLQLVDARGDGDIRLLAAVVDEKRGGLLKIYRGTTIEIEETLADHPVAIRAFYTGTAVSSISCSYQVSHSPQFPLRRFLSLESPPESTFFSTAIFGLTERFASVFCIVTK